jgi:hypothetical protein
MTTAPCDRETVIDEGLSFPGLWLGGVSLILGPLLLIIGTLLRLGVPFFFPDQLAAYQRHPTLITASYGAFLAGVILLWPGVVTVAARIAVTRPGWAAWGGALVVFGLFARAFHYGINTFAFALVDSSGRSGATRAVASYYSYPEWIASSLTASVMFGWTALAVGGFLSGVLRLIPALALTLMSGLMIGVLKGSNWPSAIESLGLAVAFVPLGIECLREAPRPPRGRILRMVALLVIFVGGSIGFGQLG